MKSNISEISSILKQEITRYKNKLDVSSVGRVVEVGDGIAQHLRSGQRYVQRDASL